MPEYPRIICFGGGG